jgi:sterol desaturase/sphingolipid hydroxylase (fatty acid hydroxylase superfamily)
MTISYQDFLRVFFFFSILIIMMVYEWKFPRRPRSISRKIRWVSNLSLVLLNTVVLRIVLPILAIGIAAIVEQKRWGLLNLFFGYYWGKIIISIILLDFIIYLQHVMFHLLPLFWRIHRIHHTDLDVDVTTGLRFHPFEIILSMIIKIIAVIVFGIPVLAILIFEILLNATSMFNHSNVYIPIKLDKYLRWLIVTPDMHRVHHSIYPEETNSNYGFNLPWWDKVCKTYKDQPQDGHVNMRIGLNMFRDIKYLNIWQLLIIPFI